MLISGSLSSAKQFKMRQRFPLSDFWRGCGGNLSSKEATHTENGNKEYYVCSCGNWYEDAEGTKLIKNHASVLLLKFELGDVDHNHKLTSMDAMLLMQYKAGLLQETVFFCTECANVDGKMGVNSIDAMLILQFRAGLITSFR